MIEQSILSNDGVGSLLAGLVAVICGYAAVLQVQRGEQHKPLLWRSLAALSLGAGIADLHFIGLADLPAAAGSTLGAAETVLTLLACLGLGAAAIHFATRRHIGRAGTVFHCMIFGVGLCLLSDRSLGLANGSGVQTSYQLAHIVPTLFVALIGSSISLTILRALRTMPERSILPPRPLAGLFIGASLVLVQSGVFHAALLPPIAAPVSMLPLWLPLTMSALLLATMALLIQLARAGLIVAHEDSSSLPTLIAQNQLLDASTRLPQRAAFMRQAPALLARAADLGLSMELIRCVVQGQGLLDAQVVENVAQTLAQRLGATMRAGDLLARHDCFEFVLLRKRESGEARSKADMLLLILCAPTEIGGNARQPMTIQAGLAEFPRDGADIRSLLLTAAQNVHSATLAETAPATTANPADHGAQLSHHAAA